MGSIPAKTPANGWLGSQYVGPTAAMAAAKKPTAAPGPVRPPVGAGGAVPAPIPPPKAMPPFPPAAPPQAPVLAPAVPVMKPVPPPASPPMGPPVVPPQAPLMKPPMVGRPLPPEASRTGLWTPEDQARADGPKFDPTTGLMTDGSAPPTRPGYGLGYGYGQKDPRTGVVHNEVSDYAPRSLADLAMQRPPATKPMPAPQPAPPGRSLMQFASRRY